MHPFRTPTPPLPPILLVGPGRVGSAFARALSDAGRAHALAGRDDLNSAPSPGIALLCVPDGEIASASRAVLAAHPGVEFIGHTSGATGLESLGADHGSASRFSVHPLQTIPDAEGSLAGAPAAVTGSGASALAIAQGLAEAIGMRPFEVPEGSRAAYHAAASIASNFLIALEESAVELLRAAGIEDGRDLLAPLVLRTAANWSERGGEALTGPIARGDEATIEAHRRALAELAPQLEPLYEALAERTRAVAGREEALA